MGLKISNLEEFKLTHVDRIFAKMHQNPDDSYASKIILDLMAMFHLEFEALTVTEDEVRDGLVLPTQDSELQLNGTQVRAKEELKALVLLPSDFFEEIVNETGILGKRKIIYGSVSFIEHK